MNLLQQLPVLLGPSPRDADSLRRTSDARLRALVRHAATHSAYFSAVFERAGLRASDIRSPADLAALPLLTRTIIRERNGELVDRRVPPSACVQTRTSGTSGEALVLPTTEAEQRLAHAIWFSTYLRCGVRPWHRQAKFVSHTRGLRAKWAFQRVGIFRRDYNLVTTPTREKIRWLREVRPDVVFAWGSVLNDLAMVLESEGARLDIPLAVSSSENVLGGIVRGRVARNVVDLYGAIETAACSVPCALGRGHHIDTRWNIIELLDAAGRPANSGRIVVTVLWRRTTPLLRYEIGDLGTWAAEPCGCGNPMPLLATLDGRVSDMFETDAGERVGNGAFVVVLRRVPGVREHQIVQPARGQMVCNVVTAADYPDDGDARISREIGGMLAGGIAVRVRRVTTLPRIPAEKQRAIVTMEHLARWRTAGHDTAPFTGTPA